MKEFLPPHTMSYVLLASFEVNPRTLEPPIKRFSLKVSFVVPTKVGSPSLETVTKWTELFMRVS